MSENASDDSEVLRQNAVFYRAFTEGDYAAMSKLWAMHLPVTCLHPGSQLLVGRGPVMASWKDILRGPPPFELRCEGAVVSRIAPSVAIVSCYEGNGQRPAHLAATNVFALEAGAWHMVHHQAGPLSTPIPRREMPSTLN
jgi:hypothetical protein